MWLAQAAQRYQLRSGNPESTPCSRSQIRPRIPLLSAVAEYLAAEYALPALLRPDRSHYDTYDYTATGPDEIILNGASTQLMIVECPQVSHVCSTHQCLLQCRSTSAHATTEVDLMNAVHGHGNRRRMWMKSDCHRIAGQLGDHSSQCLPRNVAFQRPILASEMESDPMIEQAVGQCLRVDPASTDSYKADNAEYESGTRRSRAATAS